jgi:hypothetical protein
LVLFFSTDFEDNKARLMKDANFINGVWFDIVEKTTLGRDCRTTPSRYYATVIPHITPHPDDCCV